MTTRPLDVSSGPLAPPSRLSRLGALSLATRTLALRWRAFASLRPGLAPLLALLARALLASALLLLLARLPARTPERWRWKPAAASARVYSGALALVVPFLILSALAAARPRRLIAPPKTHEIEIVGLGEAVRERGASRREARKRMDDAEGGKGAAGSEGGKGAAGSEGGKGADSSSGSHLGGSDALEEGDEEEDASAPIFSASASAALDLLASLASDSGGAETASWIRAAAKIPGALPPTAALAIIREVPRPTRRKSPARSVSTNGDIIEGHEGGSPPELGGSGTTAGGWADAPGPPAGRRRYRRRRRDSEEGEDSDSDTSTASSDSDSDSDTDSSDSRFGSHAEDSSDSRRSPTKWAETVRCARGEPVAFLTFRTERGVPRDALGPSARRAANLPWLGDVAAWFARCPETLEVRVCEALDVGGGGGASGAFANDRADRDAFARAVAKFAAADAFNATAAVRVARDEARDGGGECPSPSPSPSPWRAADATVVAIPAGDPAPFLKSALAGAGAHAVPADHESNLLALAPGGVFSPGQDVVAPSRGSGSAFAAAAAWDGRACGKDARRRREYARRARKFARRGGEVVEADPRDVVEWARDLRWAAPRTALEEAKEKAALLGGGGGGGGGGDDDARGGEEGERERDEEEDDDRDDDEPPGDESGAFALVSEDSRRASRRVGVDERARVAASLAASLASARRAEELDSSANFVSPLFLSATNGNGNAAPRAEASGGWRALEARVRDPSSGACTRVGAALFRLPAPMSSSVSSSSPAAPRRACVRAAWLSPSAEAKRLSTFAALLRGVVRAAARSECAVVDLGPGGDAEKRRLGAEARRGTWMTTFADAALAAPTRAAGRGELYEGLLRAARPSGDPNNAREEGVEGGDFGPGGAAGNDSRGAKNGSRGAETDSAGRSIDSAGRSNVANTPNPHRLSKAAASAAIASAPAASRREARRSRRREARDRRKMARVASRAFAAARAKAMAERAAGGTRDAATADGDAFVDAEEGAEA